jgi:hypothetical protein
MTQDVHTFYQGQHGTILMLPEAERERAGFDKQFRGGKPAACFAQLMRLLQRLADHKLRSPDQFNAEGDGIFAVKARCGLRAYGWFQKPGAPFIFVVGLIKHKKRANLNPADIRRVENRRRKHYGDSNQ